MITEKEIKALQFGESLRTENGERYTRTIGGWIYSNFSSSAICFIPDVKESLTTEKSETEKKSGTEKKGAKK